MERLYDKYNIHVLSDALEVSRGTFYNYIKRNKHANSYYAELREMLSLKIREIYDDSNQIFGSKKITAVMKSQGYRVSDKMVSELMQQELRNGVDNYMEFYNTKRTHAKLGYKTPKQIETAFYDKKAVCK